MSTRRKVAEIVQLVDEEEGPYLARIVEHGRGLYPDECELSCGDAECKEWPVLLVLSEDGEPTGQRVFHVSECQMQDPPAARKQGGKHDESFDANSRPT